MSARAAYIRRAAGRIAERHRERTSDALTLDRIIIDELREAWRSLQRMPPTLLQDYAPRTGGVVAGVELAGERERDCTPPPLKPNRHFERGARWPHG